MVSFLSADESSTRVRKAFRLFPVRSPSCGHDFLGRFCAFIDEEVLSVLVRVVVVCFYVFWFFFPRVHSAFFVD